MGKVVLDAACGTGYAGPMLRDAGRVTTKGQISTPAWSLMPPQAMAVISLLYQTADVTKLEPTLTPNVIVSFETVEHVPDFHAMLVNFRRILPAGGVLLVSSPNRPITTPGAASLSDKPRNPHHTQEFMPDELSHELRQAGFTVEMIYGQRRA